MRLLIVLALLSASCSSKKSKELGHSATEATSADDAAQANSPGTLEDASAEQEGMSPEALPPIPGVAPLTEEQIKAARVPGAKPLNAQGLKAHRSENYAAAIEHYKKSLLLDPGALMPRYNLACALVLSGEGAQGLALLDQFRKLACPDCRDRLDRAMVDKDWQGLWSDPLFQQIVAPVEEGNAVGVAYFDVRFPETLKKPSFTIRPRMVLDRLPGEATLPAFTLVLRDADKELARVPMNLAKRKGAQVLGQIQIPGTGRYVLSLVAKDRVYFSKVFAIRQALCFGGEKRYEVSSVRLSLESDSASYDGYDEYQQYRVGDDDEVSAFLRWPFPLPGDDNYRYLQIWKRNGRIHDVDTFDVDGTELGDEDASCPIGRPPLSIDAMADPGNWLLGLYSQNGKSFEIRYSLRRGGVLEAAEPALRVLSKPPAWTTKHFAEEELEDASRPAIWDGKGVASSTRLIRAATRSPKVHTLLKSHNDTPRLETKQALLALASKHGSPWRPSELPSRKAWPVAEWQFRHATLPEKTCIASRCSEYPAISPDGRTVVTYEPEEIEFWDEVDECNRPEGDFYRFWEAATGKEIPSRNLSGFKPMTCSSDDKRKLEAGFQITLQGDDMGEWLISIKDKTGKTVKKIEEYGSSLDYCLSPGTRTVVTRLNDSITHCHETGTTYFTMATY